MMHKWTFKGSGCFNMKIEDWKPIFNDEMHVKNGFLSLKQVIIIFFFKKSLKKCINEFLGLVTFASLLQNPYENSFR